MITTKTMWLKHVVK